MHELSIVQSIVTTVTEALSDRPHIHIQKVRLNVGVLSGIVEDALQFGYEIVTRDTILAGSSLEVITLPIVLYCESCAKLVELDGVQSFRCPDCGRLTGDIRQGRELDIESVEFEDEA